ncbi:hypothetical protein BHE74_00007838 [Ensete ventricosum]|nr:hypothetical protein BHE74_00007838 [Ensete ventricosum]
MDRAGEGIGRATLDFRFSLFFSLFFFLCRLIWPGSSRRRSKSTVIGRFRVVTGRKQPNRRYRPLVSGPCSGQQVDWYIPPVPIADLGFSALSGTSRSGPSQKRGPGRRSKKQYASSESALVSSEDSGKDVQWWRGGKFSEVILQNGTLPSSLVRKAARQDWYHADALELEEAQIFDLVGFKCCRCRRKASPKCPYLQTDSKKSEPEHVDKPNTLEGSMSDLPLLTHSSNPVSHMAGDMALVNGDPLLHTLGVVEPLPVQTLETGVQSQQKLSVRRPHLLHATDLCFESQSPERNDISHEIDDYDFSVTNDEIFASSSDMVSSFDLQESGGGAAVSVADADCGYQWPDKMCGSIEDAEYEPQTYFSFTELLASDDDRLHASDNNMNAAEIGFSSSCGEIGTFEAPAFDGLGSEEVHSTGEELVAKETTFNGVACDICKLAHPSPDLSCEICGQHIHSHCSPWVESEQPSSDANWRCGRCRDWR